MKPNQEREPYADPLIDEVRQRRQDLLARYDYDLKKFFDAVRKLQAQHPEKIVKRHETRKAR
jgi:hypothetical protein